MVAGLGQARRRPRLFAPLMISAFACAEPRYPVAVPDKPPSHDDLSLRATALAMSGESDDPTQVPLTEIPAAEPLPYEPITFAAVGDLMLGSTYRHGTRRLPPNDGADLLADATATLSAADIAFGNLEAPLYDGDAKAHCTSGAITEKRFTQPDATGCWSFRTPARYSAHLAAAGFDVVSLANNHVDDFGAKGRASTIEELDKLDIKHTGPLGTVAHLTVRRQAVDIIAFATDDGLNDMDELSIASSLVAKSKSTGAIVVVSFHGGAEGPAAMHVPREAETFHGQHRGAVYNFSHAMIDAGADLVVGHGPHVVRGMEVYKGRLIAYSLGSFATARGIDVSGPRGRTMVLEVRFAEDGALIDGRVVAMRQERPHGPRPDPEGWLVKELRRLSDADFGNGAPSFADDGSLSPPLSP